MVVTLKGRKHGFRIFGYEHSTVTVVMVCKIRNDAFIGLVTTHGCHLVRIWYLENLPDMGPNATRSRVFQSQKRTNEV